MTIPFVNEESSCAMMLSLVFPDLCVWAVGDEPAASPGCAGLNTRLLQKPQPEPGDEAVVAERKHRDAGTPGRNREHITRLGG